MQQRAPVLIGAGQMRVLNRRTPSEFIDVNYRFFPYAHTDLRRRWTRVLSAPLTVSPSPKIWLPKCLD
jgi:hypothetical protein